MKEVCKVEYQLVTPNIRRHNGSKPTIFTFKAHILAILAGIDEYLPKNS